MRSWRLSVEKRGGNRSLLLSSVEGFQGLFWRLDFHFCHAMYIHVSVTKIKKITEKKSNKKMFNTKPPSRKRIQYWLQRKFQMHSVTTRSESGGKSWSKYTGVDRGCVKVCLNQSSGPKLRDPKKMVVQRLYTKILELPKKSDMLNSGQKLIPLIVGDW